MIDSASGTALLQVRGRALGRAGPRRLPCARLLGSNACSGRGLYYVTSALLQSRRQGTTNTHNYRGIYEEHNRGPREGRARPSTDPL